MKRKTFYMGSKKWQTQAENIGPTKLNEWTTKKFGFQDQLLLKQPRNFSRMRHFGIAIDLLSPECAIFSLSLI